MNDSELLKSLRELKPTASSKTRDQLLYEAGRRSVRRTFAWPLVTVAALLLAGWSWLAGTNNAPSPSKSMQLIVQERLPELQIPLVSPDLSEQVSPFSYLALRENRSESKPTRPTVIEDQRPVRNTMLTAGSYANPEWWR